jgi:undecaprenyl-diphosphatase
MLYICLLIFMQIVLESFPVSSSGHLLLLEFFFRQCLISSNINDLINSSFFRIMLNLIHLPTALIVAMFFYKKWIIFIRHPYRMRFIITKLMLLSMLTTVITVLFFLFFHTINMGSRFLKIGFFSTACMLFLLRFYTNERKQSLTLWSAIVLGFAQGIALLPGISRFATVFFTSRLLGFSTYRSFLLTWMMEVPLIMGAVAVYGYYGLVYHPQSIYMIFSYPLNWVIFIGTLCGFISFYAVARLTYSNTLWYFSFYMFVIFLITTFFNVA